MNILVVSLNFNPGHFSHLGANYKLLIDAGSTPYLYINRLFNRMDKSDWFEKINSGDGLKNLKNIDAAVFWFPSLRNIFEIIRLKMFYRSKVIYIYHEPFDSIQNYYKSGFGFKKIAKIWLINLVNIPVIFLSDSIVLPSTSSFNLYKKKYTSLNKKYSLIPLIFDDEATADVVEVKKFISYIGTVAADHAFDRFVDFVAMAIDKQWFPDMTFLVATSSRIPAREKAILEPHLKSGKVVVSEGYPMTNEEINCHYRGSLIVWNAYNRSMQSGVLPKAYMFGAAVIVLSRNANEFVENHKTGVLIEDNNDMVKIKEAMEEIIIDMDYFSLNCRRKFLEVFYYKNRIAEFMNLLKS